MYFGVSSVSDNPLFWLVLVLKVYSCPSNAESQLNCRILICCTCHFWVSSLFFSLFRLASSACRSLQCLISALTRGGKRGLPPYPGLLSHLCCGGEDTANKHHWHVWVALTVDGPHGGCHSPTWYTLPRSKLLRCLGTSQENSPS